MSERNDDARLSPADAAALDSLGSLHATGHGEGADARGRRLAALLALLDTPTVAADASLVDLTIARLPGPDSGSLRREDARAVDAWVDSAGRPDRVPGTIGARARRLGVLADLVRDSRVDRAADLADRTMAKIQAAIDGEESRLRLPERGRGVRLRLSDAVSVAAMLLIAASVVWPMLSTLREQSRRTVCHANLGDVVRAFGGYANDHRSELPRVTAGYGGGYWLATGSDPARSNSANLYRLVESQYVPIGELACPGNPRARLEPETPQDRDWRAFEEVSYSYRVMAGPVPRWADPSVRAVVLTDRSPVFLRAIRGQPVHSMAGSPNHGGLGQHVLFNDGTVDWKQEPIVSGGDNIWFPRIIEDELRRRQGSKVDPMSGTESPAAADDAFVGP